ncbi:MAG: nicotinate phosphoribosyltransferase [bacterium]
MSYALLPYNISLTLLTDLYQLTMAYGYWKQGKAEQEGVFNLFFRKNPFNSGYTIAAGLAYVIDFINNFKFSRDDIDYLHSITGNDGNLLLETSFLDYLNSLNLTVDIEATPEGTVVFPQEPLVRVKGPLLQCQLLETALLNIINFNTLISTKAARVCFAAEGDPVLEFGLRRAQGIDGGLSMSRAAYIGGCTSTSNVLAGKLYNIPVKGTHAHSWVMCFNTELEAFDAYAQAMPNNCIFLVDTYDTLQGVRNALIIGKKLKKNGHKMAGIRLDSGDLAFLSNEARILLDEAGFKDTLIFASNDLDEHIIQSLKRQGSKIAVWGVGTNLSTAKDEPALGGVYKLTAIKENNRWKNKIKVSEQISKITNPGIQRTYRYLDNNGLALADIIYEEGYNLENGAVIVDPLSSLHQRKIERGAQGFELLVPVFRSGKCVYTQESLLTIRQRVREQLALFHNGIKRFENPHSYPVGLERSLYKKKKRLISKIKKYNWEFQSDTK